MRMSKCSMGNDKIAERIKSSRESNIECVMLSELFDVANEYGTKSIQYALAFQSFHQHFGNNAFYGDIHVDDIDYEERAMQLLESGEQFSIVTMRGTK